MRASVCARFSCTGLHQSGGDLRKTLLNLLPHGRQHLLPLLPSLCPSPRYTWAPARHHRRHFSHDMARPDGRLRLPECICTIIAADVGWDQLG